MDAEIEKVNELLDELEDRAYSISNSLSEMEIDNMNTVVEGAIQLLRLDLDEMNTALQNNDEHGYTRARKYYMDDTEFLNERFRKLADIFHEAHSALKGYL